MLPISLREMYSEPETMVDDISHLLMPNRALTQDELQDLIEHALEVFVSCGQQLPADLAHRMIDVGVDLEGFFDMAWSAMSEVGIIEAFTIN